jgi:DNA-directed RNA polymerase specialized sigma24 family protein
VTSTSARGEQIAAFYARHAHRIQRIVARRVNAPAQTIEDACQTAWTALVRRDDISLDHRGVNWLTTVAIHEGWRLVSRTHDVPGSRHHPRGIQRLVFVAGCPS